MKTGALQRSRSCRRRPDNAKTRSSQEPATINQQPSTIRGEAHTPTVVSWSDRLTLMVSPP